MITSRGERDSPMTQLVVSKKGKITVETLRKENMLDRPSTGRAHKESDECNKALLQERSLITASHGGSLRSTRNSFIFAD